MRIEFDFKDFIDKMKERIDTFINNDNPSTFLLKWSKFFWKYLLFVEIVIFIGYIVAGFLQNTIFYTLTNCYKMNQISNFCSYYSSLRQYFQNILFGMIILPATKILASMWLLLLDLIDAATNFYKKIQDR
ncbi:MAG: hypothetical protein Ta2D_11130 [Rickettsiales bacterium]|nr:MAG: hypothetical protein Ta2D_11130 [Rickettsiales bacterium]